MSFIGEDRKRVDGLRLLAANDKFDIEFYDESVKTPYNSENEQYIKSKIKPKIDRSSITVCLISEETHKSEWVDWELGYSFKKGNRVIAMALKDIGAAIVPKLIKQNAIAFLAWDHDQLFRLISNV